MWLFFPTYVGKLWGFLKQSLISFLFFFFFITDDFILLEFNASVSLGKLIDYVCYVCTTLIELIWWVWVWHMHARMGGSLHSGWGPQNQLRAFKSKGSCSQVSCAVFPASCCSEKYIRPSTFSLLLYFSSFWRKFLLKKKGIAKIHRTILRVLKYILRKKSRNMTPKDLSRLHQRRQLLSVHRAGRKPKTWR